MPLINTELPLVAAPMAGGPSTPALVTAAGECGGFGFLAAGYKRPDDLEREIAQVRAHTDDFGVNVFVPSREKDGSVRKMDPAAYATYAAALAGEAAIYGLELADAPQEDDDWWQDKLELLVADPVPVVSLTFALPMRTEIAALQRAGSLVLASVTSASEARAAVELGVDGLVVQGPGAGGHSASFEPAGTPSYRPTADVVREVRAVTNLPVVAAGGVGATGDIADLLASGAELVAIGTLLLLADEAGTSAIHRSALTNGSFADTVITRAFTGRPARALRNGFADRYTPVAPTGYPAIHHLTRGLRQAASQNGDAERVHLWAGTAHRQARPGSIRSILDSLASDL